MSNLTPYQTILYKLDDSEGWFYALMSGDRETCKRRCNELKKIQGWHDYKMYSGGTSMESYKDVTPIIPNAHQMHQTTNLIYFLELNKWYEQDETIPRPSNSCEIADEFLIDFNFDKEMNDGEFKEGENPHIYVDLKFITRVQKVELCAIWELIKEDADSFILKLEQNRYANIIIDELSYTKLLAWQIDDKIRFIIQDYNDQKVIVTLDALIDKKLFLNEYQRTMDKIKKGKPERIKSYK